MSHPWHEQARDAATPVARRTLIGELPPIGIVYGRVAAANLSDQEKQFGGIVVEPGFYDRAPVPSAIAYVPLSGFNIHNPSHAPWIERLEAVGGFLPDDLRDPNGPGTRMIDWRMPEVRSIMQDYLSLLQAQGYTRFFFDAVDSVSAAEYRDSDLQGLSQQAAYFVAEQPGEHIVNGGLFDAHGTNLLPIWARSGKALALESALSLDGDPRSAADQEWLRGRISEFVRAGGEGSRVYFIEHAPVAYRDGLRSEAYALLDGLPQVDFSLYVTTDLSYQQLTPQYPSPEKGAAIQR